MNTSRNAVENWDIKEIKAAKLLKEVGISALPIPVEQIAYHLNIKVQYAAFDDDLSGLIYREETDDGEEITTVIGINSAHPPRRRRFSLAHEIGHFVLGHLKKAEFETLHIDRKFACLPRNGRSSEGTNSLEIEANGFAAALLMPAKQLREDFKKFKADSIECFDYEDDELASALAKRYNVSLQAMIIRLTRLALIEEQPISA